MYKGLIVGSLAVFMLSLNNGVSAQLLNPFEDVPPGHWAYKAINQLVEAGVVDRYQSKFNGSQILSRYEMAQLVEKAMDHKGKVDGKTQDALNMLANEFADEMKSVDAQIAELENRNDQFSLASGNLRLRYPRTELKKDGQTISKTSDAYAARTTLSFKGQVNNSWNYRVMLRSTNNLDRSGDETTSALVQTAYLTGPVGATNVTFGRMSTMPLDGSLWDTYYDGIRVAFGGELKTTLYYGRHSRATVVPYDKTDPSKGNVILSGTSSNPSDTRMYGGLLDYKFNDRSRWRGTYYLIDAVDMPDEFTNKYKVWQTMLNHDLGNDFDLVVTYGQSDAKMDNANLTVTLSHGKALRSRPGTSRTWLAMRDMERFFNYGSPTHMTAPISWTSDPITSRHNSRAWELGYTYVPMRNVTWTNALVRNKSTDGTNLKQELFYSTFYLYF